MTHVFPCLPSGFRRLRPRWRSRGNKTRNDTSTLEGTNTRVLDPSSPASVASPLPGHKAFRAVHPQPCSAVSLQKSWLPTLRVLASPVSSACCGGQNSQPSVSSSEPGDRNTKSPLISERHEEREELAAPRSTQEVRSYAEVACRLCTSGFPCDTECQFSRTEPPTRKDADEESKVVRSLHQPAATCVRKPGLKVRRSSVGQIPATSRPQARKKSVEFGLHPQHFSIKEKQRGVCSVRDHGVQGNAGCSATGQTEMEPLAIPKMRSRGLPQMSNMACFLPSSAKQATPCPIPASTALPAVSKASTFLDRFWFGRGKNTGSLRMAANDGAHQIENEERIDTEFTIRMTPEDIDRQLSDLGGEVHVGDEDLLFLSDMTTHINCHFVDL